MALGIRVLSYFFNQCTRKAKDFGTKREKVSRLENIPKALELKS